MTSQSERCANPMMCTCGHYLEAHRRTMDGDDIGPVLECRVADCPCPRFVAAEPPTGVLIRPCSRCGRGWVEHDSAQYCPDGSGRTFYVPQGASFKASQPAEPRPVVAPGVLPKREPDVGEGLPMSDGPPEYPDHPAQGEAEAMCDSCTFVDGGCPRLVADKLDVAPVPCPDWEARPSAEGKPEEPPRREVQPWRMGTETQCESCRLSDVHDGDKGGCEGGGDGLPGTADNPCTAYEPAEPPAEEGKCSGCGHEPHEGRCKMGVRPDGRPIVEDGRMHTLIQCHCIIGARPSAEEPPKLPPKFGPDGKLQVPLVGSPDAENTVTWTPDAQPAPADGEPRVEEGCGRCGGDIEEHRWKDGKMVCKDGVEVQPPVETQPKACEHQRVMTTIDAAYPRQGLLTKAVCHDCRTPMVVLPADELKDLLMDMAATSTEPDVNQRCVALLAALGEEGDDG